MKKTALAVFAALCLSCSFIDEAKAMAFHSDCYLALKEYLKEDPAGKWESAFVEEAGGKTYYSFKFTEEAPLTGHKTDYRGTVSVVFYWNEAGKGRMEYNVEAETFTSSMLMSLGETEDLVSHCLVNELGTVLEGFSQVRRSTSSTTVGYTNIANLEGYLILLPLPEDAFATADGKN